MAEETSGTTAVAELSADAQMDKDLAALLTPEKPAEAAAEVTLGATPAVVPAQAETPVEETLEAKLAKIDEAPAKVEPEAPKLSSEQQRILDMVPNAQVAEQVTLLANSYKTFTGAFERGDFDAVETMLQEWKPEIYEAFLEHIYQKNVASEKWLGRWMDEKEGKVPNSPALRSMQQQISQLKTSLQQQEQQKLSQSQEQYNAKIARDYVGHIDGLFAQINFSEADRPLVREIIDKRVAQNMAVRQAIHAGDTKAVNAIFKAAVSDYVKRDQAMAQTKVVHDPNGIRKPLAQGGGMQQEGSVTNEAINAAKGDDRAALLERKMDEELSDLFAKAKR